MVKDPPDADLSAVCGMGAAGGVLGGLGIFGVFFECSVQGLLLANDDCVASFGTPREADASGGAARLAYSGPTRPITLFIPYLGPNRPASHPFLHKNTLDAEPQRSWWLHAHGGIRTVRICKNLFIKEGHGFEREVEKVGFAGTDRCAID